MQLDGPQRGELQRALLSAFTIFTLPQMMTTRLNKELFNYAPPMAGFTYMVFEVVEAANREGWIGDLIVKAREYNPGNPQLYEFTQKLGLASALHDVLERMVESQKQL